MFDVLAVLLDLVRIEDARDARANGKDTQLAVRRIVRSDVLRDGVAGRTGRRVVEPLAAGDSVQVWSHDEQQWVERSKETLGLAKALTSAQRAEHMV